MSIRRGKHISTRSIYLGRNVGGRHDRELTVQRLVVGIHDKNVNRVGVALVERPSDRVASVLYPIHKCHLSIASLGISMSRGLTRKPTQKDR